MHAAGPPPPWSPPPLLQPKTESPILSSMSADACRLTGAPHCTVSWLQNMEMHEFSQTSSDTECAQTRRATARQLSKLTINTSPCNSLAPWRPNNDPIHYQAPERDRIGLGSSGAVRPLARRYRLVGNRWWRHHGADCHRRCSPRTTEMVLTHSRTASSTSSTSGGSSLPVYGADYPRRGAAGWLGASGPTFKSAAALSRSTTPSLMPINVAILTIIAVILPSRHALHTCLQSIIKAPITETRLWQMVKKVRGFCRQHAVEVKAPMLVHDHRHLHHVLLSPLCT